MKKYKTQAEIDKDIVNDELIINEDVKFECSFKIKAKLKVAGDINAGDINARDINAQNINAGDINAGDINAWDINAQNINARDINAQNINAGDINARDINARDILFFAVATAYISLKCKSIKGRREN